MFEQFKARAEGVSAEVHHFTSRAEAFDSLIRILKKEGVADDPHSQAVWAEGPFLNGIDRNALREVPGLSFDVTRDLAADALIGISEMTWGLADTGTLVQDSTAIEQRLVSSLPAIHVAIVSTSGILPDMPALLARINPAECGYLAMITGPSRTADIERVLTIGVHGPERLIIIAVDDLGGEN